MAQHEDWRKRSEERARLAKELEEQVYAALKEAGYPEQAIRREYKARMRLFDFGIVDPDTGDLVALVDSKFLDPERLSVHPIIIQNMALVAETLGVPLFIATLGSSGHLELLEPRDSGTPNRWPRKSLPEGLPSFDALRSARLAVLAKASKKGRDKSYRGLVLVSFVTAGLIAVLLVGDIVFRETNGHSLLEDYHWLVFVGIYVALALPFYKRISIGPMTVERMLAEDDGET